LTRKELFIAYLRHYSDKDIAKISDMLAEGIRLRDWKISVLGKATAIAETEKNFNSVDTIEIDILHIYESEQTVTGELRIVVDKTETLHVVDIITFNENNKIESIRAYLGRSD